MHTIVFSNRKGGVGKTTVAQNVGWALAAIEGLRVLLIDFDSQANLTLYFGYKPTKGQSSNIERLLEDPEAPWEPLAITERLDLLTASVALTGHDRASLWDLIGPLRTILTRATEKGYDLVLVDTMPAFGSLTGAALAVTDFVIPVHTLGSAGSDEGLERLKENVKPMKDTVNMKLQILGIIPTFAKRTRESAISRNDLKAQQDEEGIRIFAEVPQDERVNVATRNGEAVLKRHANDPDRAPGAFLFIADEICSALKLKKAKV